MENAGGRPPDPGSISERGKLQDGSGFGVGQHPVAVECDVAGPAPHGEKAVGSGAHGVGQGRRVVDRFGDGGRDVAVSGLPVRAAGKDRVGLGGVVGVEGVIGVRGLVEEAEEEGVAADRCAGAKQGDDGFDGAQVGRLQRGDGAVLPREPGVRGVDQPGGGVAGKGRCAEDFGGKGRCGPGWEVRGRGGAKGFGGGLRFGAGFLCREVGECVQQVREHSTSKTPDLVERPLSGIRDDRI